MWRDVRGSFRLWRKRPLVTTAALLTIALGAGMNIALFRVIWSVLLKPLPYADAGRLVQVWRVDQRGEDSFSGRDRRTPDGRTIQLWRARNHSFDGLASFRPWRATIGSGGDPERIPAGLVSAGFFETLGVAVQFGRTFAAADDVAGAEPVVMLSYGYWQRRFADDRRMLAGSILVDGQLTRVIGVLPSTFRDTVTYGAVQPDVYLPISKIAKGPLKVSSGFVIARLKRAVSASMARPELVALAEEAAHEQNEPVEKHGVNITSLQDEAGFSLRPALLALFAATGCVLLIASTNVANLLLAQAVARRQELSIRAALGAGRMRLVRQLFTEAMVLAVAGGLAGLGAGWALSRAMIALYPGELPRMTEGGTSGAVLAFALMVTMAGAAFFGALPAWLATRGDSGTGLRTGKAWMGRGAGHWRDTLIALQVAMTVMVLIAAGLLMKSFAALRSTDLGFEHARLLTAQVVLPETRYKTPEDRTRFTGQWIDRLKAIPGVEEAAVTNSLPLAFNLLMSVQFDVPGQTEELLAGGRAVTGDYFDAIGLRMREGRPLTEGDDGRRDVVVVNQSFVRRFLKKVPVAGTPIHFGKDAATIVGVVGDLRNMGLDRKPEPEIYMPFAALPSAYLDVVVRTAIRPAEIATAARAQLRALDPGLALDKVSTMDRILDDNVAHPHFQAVLLGLFAAVAIALAAIGVYGVIAQGVRSRTAEFGLRIALGARSMDVYRLVLGRGLRAPIVGLAIGMAGALAWGHLLKSLLFGVVPHDPLVICGTAAFILLLCLIGCALPARQAARVDPARALRDE